MTARPIITGGQAASCYFRTTVDHPNRKALVQICEPCNALCAHCFEVARTIAAAVKEPWTRGSA